MAGSRPGTGAAAPRTAGAATDLPAHLLGTARRILGGTGVLFGLSGEDQAVLATDGVPPGLARATLLRGGLASLAVGEPVRVIAPVRADEALGPLGRHAEVALVSVLTDGRRPVAVVVSLLDGPPSPEAVATWSDHLPTAGRALVHGTLTARTVELERQLASLVLAVPSPLLVTDGNGRIRAINPTAAEILGLNPAFDVGSRAAARIRSPELVALLAAPGGGSEDIEISGSQPRTLRANVVPVRREDGAEAGRVLSLEDVTAQREAEQVKADLVAVLGHELRTPLTMIRGYASTLSKRGDDLAPAARQKAIDALHQQTGRLYRLIEDLLLVAGVERDRSQLHLEEVDVRDVVRRGCGQAMDQHPGHRIEVEVPEKALLMEVDEVKLQQVLHHLVDNACKFSEPDTPVVVTLAGAEEGGCLVEVRDRGIGIFSGDQASLFERFRQVDGTATRKHGGTGVGLYICRRLIEAHGGRIGVRSALGHGSTFWFRLPVGVEEPDQPS